MAKVYVVKTRVCLQCPTVFVVKGNGSKLHCSLACGRRTQNQRARGCEVPVPYEPIPIPGLHHPFKPTGIQL